jgi:methyl-accepting chemotaxis protein
MQIRFFRTTTLKGRVFGLVGFLGLLPIICLAATYYSMSLSKSAETAMETANRGAINLGQLNASVYAVVMESRGIYMSPDWKTAEPFAKQLERHLADLQKVMGEWKGNVIEAERARITSLAANLDQFSKFRRELVRLAREDSTAAARAFGDNDANRKTRAELNTRLVELTQAYLGYQDSARELMQSVERLNFYMLIAIAATACVVGIAGTVFVHRTVIMLFTRMRTAMVELAAGNFQVEFQGAERHDEIGDFARAFQSFKDAAMERISFEQEASEQRERLDAERSQTEAARAKQAAEQAQAMQTLADALEQLSHGDLTIRLPDDFSESFKQVKGDFDAAVARLNDTITSITSATREVSSAAAEISSSTTDLSQRTETQAATLEQTTASMEQISATVKKNAENARQANTLTQATREVADRGGQVVSDAVTAMARIEQSSHKIADIIGVIDEIARQTNLLALNAAVEAARAGDAGRGFAVVASEVRSLAQRSSEAAKGIKDLIANSSHEVQGGVELVNRAGTSLKEIVGSIKQVATIVADIAEASHQQSIGIDQINKALNQMDEVTQQNSALVEENAATAKTLEHQAGAMNERVDFFQISRNAGDQYPAEPVRSRPAVRSVAGRA